MHRRSARLLVSALALGGVTLCAPTPARACGGCFHEPKPNETASVVTDHRMAFAVSPTQTVLWDRIRYQGDPANFAWVLPVGQGAYVELAHDEWLAALEAVTAPAIFAPPVSCQSNAGGGGFGCGADSASESFDGGSDAGIAKSVGVQVISQAVVGPYDVATIRSSSGEAISTWLTDNGYAIPPNIQPILDEYTTEGFDFIALKLAPDQGVQAMQPVRVITPGAGATLPLRMVAAGIGSSVGLTLYIVAEGRYEPTSFPSLLVDRSKVVWDPYALHSNYAQLFDDTVAAGQGWVTEFAGAATQVAASYKASCIGKAPVETLCDAGVADASMTDANVSDADLSDADLSDADLSDAMGSGDASAADAGPCVQNVPACETFDDYDVATQGMDPYRAQVTRIRTTLPAAALAVDLQIGASADQSPLSNVIQTQTYSDASYDPCGPASSTNKRGDGCSIGGDGRAAAWSVFGLVALALTRRRRARRRV